MIGRLLELVAMGGAIGGGLLVSDWVERRNRLRSIRELPEWFFRCPLDDWDG